MSCVLYIEPIRGNTRPWRAASHAKFTSTYLVLSKGALPKSITAMTLACKRFVTAQRPSTSSCPQVKPSVPHVDLVRAAHSLLLSSAACVALVASPLSAHALPPPSSDPARCSVEALDKFADTRAKFSQEASGGNMTEANVDIRGCDYSNKDLSGKVLSGVNMQGADFTNSKLVGSQIARADAKGAKLSGVDFTDTNCYSTSFDGADLHDAQFENSILTAATFGKDAAGNWANLQGTHFEGALVSSSDVVRICENPTLEESTKKFELGCRLPRK